MGGIPVQHAAADTGNLRQKQVQELVWDPMHMTKTDTRTPSPNGAPKVVKAAATARTATGARPPLAQTEVEVLRSTAALLRDIYVDAMKRFGDGVGAVVAGASEGKMVPPAAAQCLGRPAFPRMRQFKRACLMESIRARSHLPGFKELAESLADEAAPDLNDHAGARNSRLAELQSDAAHSPLPAAAKTLQGKLGPENEHVMRHLMRQSDACKELAIALAGGQADKTQLEPKIQQQQQEVAGVHADKTQLQTQAQQLLLQLAHEVAGVQADKTQLESRVQQLQQDMAGVQADKTQLASQVRQLQREVERQQEQLGAQQQQLTGVLADRGRLESRVQQQQQELARQQQQLTGVRADRRQLESQVQQLQQEVERKQQQLAGALTGNGLLESRVQQQQQEVEKQQQQLAGVRAENRRLESTVQQQQQKLARQQQRLAAKQLELDQLRIHMQQLLAANINRMDPNTLKVGREGTVFKVDADGVPLNRDGTLCDLCQRSKTGNGCRHHGDPRDLTANQWRSIQRWQQEQLPNIRNL